MIATGSGVSHDIGRYIDIVLENGTVIPCVIGDAKDDAHTDQEFHIMTKIPLCQRVPCRYICYEPGFAIVRKYVKLQGRMEQ